MSVLAINFMRALRSQSASVRQSRTLLYDESDPNRPNTFKKYLQEEREKDTEPRSSGSASSAVSEIVEAPADHQIHEAPNAERSDAVRPIRNRQPVSEASHGAGQPSPRVAQEPRKSTNRRPSVQSRNDLNSTYFQALKRVSSYKTIFLYDDSVSMLVNDHHKTAYHFLNRFHPVAVDYGGINNVEIRFTSDDKKDPPLTRLSKTDFYERIKPRQRLPLSNALERIMNPFQRKARVNDMPTTERPGLHIICITDGYETDQDAVGRSIKEIAAKLTQKDTALNLAGFQFVHVGEDDIGKKFCEWLDDGLDGRDIVDTVHYQIGEELTEYLKAKVLQGGVNKTLDQESK